MTTMHIENPNMIKIESKLSKQLAYIFYAYGDNPDKLMLKLHKLVIEWHCKGISIGIESSRRSNGD